MSSVRESPILVVAALSRELRALHSEAHAGVELLETGEGIANAERCLDARLERGSARAVLSIGFAGALSESLRVGDLVIAKTVYGSQAFPDPELLATAAMVRVDSAVRFGTAITAERILWQSSEKRAFASLLHAEETGFVDMESRAIVSVCERRGVPFLITRSITDRLEEDLPIDFNQCRNVDGRVNAGKVMRAAMFKPGSLNGLLELRRRSDLCAERMAAFVRGLLPLINRSENAPTS
jgi:adenosylhomocysteine nucleosidase